MMGSNICKITVQFTGATEYKPKTHLEKEMKKKIWVVTFPTYTLPHKSVYFYTKIIYHLSHLESC